MSFACLVPIVWAFFFFFEIKFQPVAVEMAGTPIVWAGMYVYMCVFITYIFKLCVYIIRFFIK